MRGALAAWVNKYRTEHAGDEPPLTLSERARLRERTRCVVFADGSPTGDFVKYNGYQSCGTFELERIPTLQLVLLLFGHAPHQGFIISSPETLGTEQHHVTTNSALNSDKVLDGHLGVVKITDIGRKIAHYGQEWKPVYREVFGPTDRTIHQPELSKLLLDLYQESLTPPQVNHLPEK
jgi:hypothetical protein